MKYPQVLSDFALFIFMIEGSTTGMDHLKDTTVFSLSLTFC